MRRAQLHIYTSKKRGGGFFGSLRFAASNDIMLKTVWRSGMDLKEKWKQALYRIRNPERGENEREFMRELGFKRLLFFLPFLIAAALVWLLSLSR
jgi:hypothetical protein